MHLLPTHATPGDLTLTEPFTPVRNRPLRPRPCSRAGPLSTPATDGNRCVRVFHLLNVGNMCFLSKNRRLRSASQPLQSREPHGAALATEPPRACVETEGLCRPFPRQHTTRHPAAGDVRPLGPLRAHLTTGQAEGRLADAHHVITGGAAASPLTPLGGRPPQALGGLVRGAVADHEPCPPPRAVCRSPPRPGGTDGDGARARGPGECS
jgi:hypothetical protein